MSDMTSRSIVELTAEELIEELGYVNRMCKFYYGRKEELMKEIERREKDGKNL